MEYYYIPFTILPTNMNVSKFKGIFQFHNVKNLSSAGQQYCWTTTTMGLRGASRLSHHIFNKMKKVVCYTDDILVISSTQKKMLQLLYEVCADLRYHGLKANPRKLLAGLKKIKYLGYW